MYRLVDIIADTLPDNHPWKGNVYGLVEKLVERGVTIQQWISVKDRLPETPYKYDNEFDDEGPYFMSNYVLAFSPFNDPPVFTGRYCTINDTNVFCTYSSGCGDVCETVTHWMPIPEPPKTE